MRSPSWTLALALVAGALVLVLFLQSTTVPLAELGESRLMSLVYVLCRLLLVGTFILKGFKGQLRVVLGYGLAWSAIGLVLVAGYGYRQELKQAAMRVRAELLPGYAVTTGSDLVVVRRADDGHFYLRAEVEGQPVRFLVDTGATTVALPAATARRIGIDTRRLRYDDIVDTANGEARSASIVLGEVAVGGIVIETVAAAVMPRGGLTTPLLGMSFLNRLDGFAIEGDRLTLRAPAGG